MCFLVLPCAPVAGPAQRVRCLAWSRRAFVSPPSTLSTWCPCPTRYDLVVRDSAAIMKIADTIRKHKGLKSSEPAFGCIIVDEGHRLKNPEVGVWGR